MPVEFEPDEEEASKKYNVFHRTWWKKNPAWPGGKEPEAGKCHYIVRDVSYSIARQVSREWNEEHRPRFPERQGGIRGGIA